MRTHRISSSGVPAEDAQVRLLPRSLRGIAAALVLACPLVSGCLFMPGHGTPVFVDMSTGDYWSGEALLLEVSEDQARCLVAARDPALFVHERWVPCAAVHSRRARDR